MNAFRSLTILLVILTTLLSACAGLIPTPEPQPPKEYLENALNWIQTHAVFGDDVDWEEVRREAFALAPNPQTTADTHPAIRLALQRLDDGFSSLELPLADRPDRYTGMWAVYPENTVIVVDHGGPAERAGVRVGDVIELINGALPKPFRDNPAFSELDFGANTQVQLTLRRAGQVQLIEVTVDQIAFPADRLDKPVGRRLSVEPNGVGYIESTGHSGYPLTWPGLAHQLIRKIDREPVCGWIIDIRRIGGGDIWSYLAALGPIMGEGDVGGFAYLDGAHELWRYLDGKVFWADNEREESLVEGGIYTPKREMPPVALLISRATSAAGELVIVAFEGREKVRTFGEPTRGIPTLNIATGLSDGAIIYISGAFSTDRNGKLYDGPILSDENVKTDWVQFGTDQDPVILAALDWLKTQPECGN